MTRRKREMGRPTKNRLPPRIDGSPEDIAKAVFAAGPNLKQAEGKVYRCKSCESEVHYPDTLYEDGLCASCRKER